MADHTYPTDEDPSDEEIRDFWNCPDNWYLISADDDDAEDGEDQ